MQSILPAQGIRRKANVLRLLLPLTPLLLFGSLHAQTVTLTVKEAPLKKVFSEIKKQTGYQFLYTSELLEDTHPVSFSVRQSPLQNVLQLCFENQPVTYAIEDKFIAVRKKETQSDSPQKTTLDVKGRVVGENGQGLAGASVIVKGTANATATDQGGIFLLEDVDEKAVLLISSIGYKRLEIPLNGRTSIEVRLGISISSLDETVVIAYGTTTNRLNTGNVTKITGEEISKQPVSNPLAALEGRVPGMIVTQNTGLPGASLKVQIRGRTALDPTLTDDQPLFVIDGVPYAPNNGYLNTLRSALGSPSNLPGVVSPGGLSPFSSINPSDIESIEVLKDADATAIYGSRGANGVVLITTKKGRAGKTLFNFSAQSGISKVTRTSDLLSLRQYLEMRHEAFQNDGVTPAQSNAFDLLVWDTTRYTDFTKLLIGGSAHLSDIQGSVSGGSGNTQFLLGGSYHYESTVFPLSPNDKRGGLHFNVGHTTSNQKFSAQLSGSYSADDNNLIATDLTALINLPPNFKLYDSLGGLAWNEGGVVSGYNNPLAYLNQTYKARTDNLMGNLSLSYKPLKWIALRLNSGYNSVLLNESKTSPLTSQNPQQNPVRAASFSANLFKSWILEPQAEYQGNISSGKLGVLVGSTLQSQSNDLSSLDGRGYIDDALLGSLSGAASISGSKTFSLYRYEALFGRINYNWKNKYILNLSTRRDGSSKFGPGKQFASFGSAGAGWIFSNEDFFSKHFSFLSFGKLRASYGTTGNDKIANYQFLDTWSPTFNSYQNGPGLTPSKLFNPDYHWEKTTKLEAALSLGFLKDRFFFSFSYYRNRSSNQLVQYKLPTTTGFVNVVQNLPAMVQNSGIELSLSSTNVTTVSFKWLTAANLTIPKNKLVSFPGLSSTSYASQYVIGEPLNVIYKYKYSGVDPVTGLYTVKDLTKDSSFNTLDYQPVGCLDPRFYGGVQNTLQYKGFQLDFFLQFISQTGLNYLGNAGFPAGLIYNMPTDILSRWQKPGDLASVQKFTQATNSPAYKSYSSLLLRSNGIYSDASFIRLKNASIAYSFPDKGIKKAGIASLKVYLTGQNLFTLTSYKGGDPETQNFLRMPPLRTLVGGIQLTF